MLALPLKFDIQLYRSFFEKADLVVINGEGSIHHGRNLHLIQLAAEYPSVLVNCVYQENPQLPELKKFLHISARESHSVREINSQGAACELVPDMLFACNYLRSFPRRQIAPTQALGVTDNVVKQYRHILGFKRKLQADISAHGLSPAEHISQVLSYASVCSGRFHTAIVCAVLGVPFSTWDSNTWKTSGMMADAGVAHLHFASREEAIQSVPHEFPEQLRDFCESARLRIERNIDRIAELAAGGALAG